MTPTSEPAAPKPRRRWRRGLLVVVLVFAALSALAAWLLPKLIDPNRYRDHIAALVRAETGRDLKLGPMQLKVFPWLRLTVADASLGDAAGFGPEPMLKLARLELGVELWPLLSQRKVVVDVVRLERPVLRLAHDASGRSNWQDLLDWQRSRPKSEPLDLDLAGIELADARIVYRAASGQALHLGPLQARSGRVRGNQPVALQVSTLFANRTPAAAGALELALVVDWQDQQHTLRLSDLILEGKGVLADANAPVTANLLAKTETLTLQLAEHWALQTAAIALDVRSLRVGSQAAPKLFSFGQLAASLAGQGADQSLRIKGFRAEAQARGSWLPEGARLQPLALALADAQWQMPSRSGTMQGLQLTGYGLPIAGDLVLAFPADGPHSMSGLLTTPQVDLRAVLARFGVALPPMASAQALRSVRLATKLNYRNLAAIRSLAFTEIDAAMDASTLSGSLEFVAFSPLSMALDLRVDSLNADGYLPAVKAAAPVAVPIQQMDFSAVEPLLSQLQTLPVVGSLRFGKLAVRGLEAEDLVVELTPNGAGHGGR